MPDLPLPQAVSSPLAPPTSEAAVACFHDLMREQTSDTALAPPSPLRALGGKEGSDTAAPFTIPAEMLAAGVQRGLHRAPAALVDGAAFAGAAQAEVAQNDEVAALLQHFSANLYVADSQKAGMGHIMVDLGATLPGSSVEMTRDGVFLTVRLHAADETMLRMMRGGSARLLDALNKSTGLVVRLDLVQRSGAHGDAA